MTDLNKTSKAFLLSPAHAGGARASALLREEAAFDLAVRLRQGEATIGEVYAFISGLYFRGKLAYVNAFASAPSAAMVIVPGRGLLDISTRIDHAALKTIASVNVDEANPLFTSPLLRDAEALNSRMHHGCQVVLLGSIATQKYTGPLLEVFGERLLFPAEFVGRGDMSRGGLMLRCADAGEELTYVPVRGAVRHGRRPPKLGRRRNALTFDL